MAKVLLLCPSCKKTLMVDDKIDGNRSMKCPKCQFTGIVSQFPEAPLKNVACPECKTVLTVDQHRTGDIECPRCHHGGDVSSYLPVPVNIPSAGAGRRQADGATAVVNKQASGNRLSVPAVLVLQSGVCAPQTVVLTKGMNTIGRKGSSSTCSIQLDSKDEFISRNHARIEFKVCADRTYEYFLSDFESKNGTFLNEKRIEKGETVVLSLKDKIRLGYTVFQFTLR